MPCQLVFLSGQRVGTAIRFEQHDFWMGRDPRCELALDPHQDLQVSGRHAEIIQVGQTYQLRDASTNGTFVNGQRIKHAILKDGDVLELGQGGLRLRFELLPTATGPSIVASAAPAFPSSREPARRFPLTEPLTDAPLADASVGSQPQAFPPTAAAQPEVQAFPPTAVAQSAAQASGAPLDRRPPTDVGVSSSHAALQVQHSAGAQGAPQELPRAVAAQPAAAPAEAPRPATAADPLSDTNKSSSAKSFTSFASYSSSMAQLNIVLERMPSGPRFTFHQPVIRIGRDPSSDLALDPQVDLLVSQNHAKIMCLQGRAVLFDVESRNGTWISEQRVSRQVLEGGEIISLGQGGPEFRITIHEEEKPVAQHAQLPTVKGGTVFGDATEFKHLSLGEAALLQEYTLERQLTIGRETLNAIVLDSMYISGRHAVIERRGDEVHLTDGGSANGTYLDGERITDAVIRPGTEFVIGPYVLKFTGSAVLVFDTRTKTWVDAYELCRTDPKTQRNFLDRVSLKIQPGEFVCILGPSGCGKSTLLKSLNGSSRADQGTVLMNNINFYAHYEQLKHQVGYVPQDDIIHPQLTIWRTLSYAAKLRLPPGSGTEKREERIRDVLSTLELLDHRHKPISKLSGGQRKRVSIAVELLTDPAIIYLDEPTSGLDPNLEEKMMLLLREMTLRGKTVTAVTHTLDHIHLADKITFLVDGKLAFFGNEDEARSFFTVDRLPDIYKRFEEHKEDTDGLRQRFEASPIFEQNIRQQLAPQTSEPRPAVTTQPRGRRSGPNSLHQFWVLTTRYLEILTRDLRNTAILLLQAPLVALFICLAVKTDQPERGPTSTMFLIMSLSALWFGCSNAAREITKESSIYARERMVNLRIIPYVASKFFVLQWLALLQVTTMLVIVAALRSGYVLSDPPAACTRWGIQACSLLILDGVPGNFWLHLLNLYLTALNGIGLGLLVSALAGNSDKAMSLVPLILIPQVLFSGSFGIPKVDETLKRSVGYVMSLNWSLDQAKRIAMCSPGQEKPTERPGEGCTTCLHGYDPFKHLLLKKESQLDDGRCAAVLPLASQMFDFPEALQVMEDGLYTPSRFHDHGPAREASKAYHGFFVLGGFVFLLFGLVGLFMRLKDRQHR